MSIYSLLVTALVATLTAPAASASAGVVLNTIDRTASLDAARGNVEVTGPIRCSQAERATIRVTVSQRTTGAVAEGSWRGRCRRATRAWTARAELQGAATFRTGRARACALGVTRRGGTATDAKQWCETIRLVN